MRAANLYKLGKLCFLSTLNFCVSLLVFSEVVLKKINSKEPCSKNMRTANLYELGIIRLSIFGCAYNFVWLYKFSLNSFLKTKIAKIFAPGTCVLQNSLRGKVRLGTVFSCKKIMGWSCNYLNDVCS